jgi:DNA-binding response OmpR family regulator
LEVVIAEDDEAIAQNVVDGLQTALFRTHWIRDGVDAINWILFHKPDAIVLDLMLPRLGGAEICALVRKTSHVSTTPIVVISGHSQTERKLQLFDLGADDYVTKPFSMDELIARLEAIFNRSRFFGPPRLRSLRVCH